MDNVSRGPTFADFVTIVPVCIEGSMQDITVTPCTTLRIRGSWVISAYLCLQPYLPPVYRTSPTGIQVWFILISMLHYTEELVNFKKKFVKSSPLKGLGHMIEFKYLDKNEQFW